MHERMREFERHEREAERDRNGDDERRPKDASEAREIVRADGLRAEDRGPAPKAESAIATVANAPAAAAIEASGPAPSVPTTIVSATPRNWSATSASASGTARRRSAAATRLWSTITFALVRREANGNPVAYGPPVAMGATRAVS